MAQIHIQRKRRRFWPLVVALIAAALLTLLLFRWLGANRDPGEIEHIDTGKTSEQQPPAPQGS